jgi:hypothetical protein
VQAVGSVVYGGIVKKDQMGIVMAVSAATLLSSGCGNGDAGSNGGGTGGETAAGAGAGGSAGSRAGGGGRAGNAGSATGGVASGASGRAGGGTGGDGMEGGAAGEAGGPQVMCDNPVFTTSDTNGGWSDGGYYVHNNIWNADEAGPETLYACSYKNWYVTSTQPDTTSVKAYPNVHLDIDNLNGLPISNYATITSTFAATAPDVGIYNVAYDLWLDGVGWGNGTTELMIWTENHGQVPLGNTVPPQMTFGGERYDVYRHTSSSDGGVQVITLLSTEAQTSGSVDLKEILNWIVDEAWISADATINQIGYGVEICSTEDQPATFYFTDFSVTMN